LAVTYAKIDDLAVGTAKIDNLAVTTAKIDDAAIKTAKIDNAAITNIKILSGEIEFAKVDSDFGKGVFFQHNKIIFNAGALTDDDVTVTGSGSYLVRHGYMKGETGTTQGSDIIVEDSFMYHAEYNPLFRVKVKWSSSTKQTWSIRMQQQADPQNWFGFRLLGTDSYIQAWGRNGAGGTEWAIIIVPYTEFDSSHYYILEAVYDYDTGNIKFYVDGILKHTQETYMPTSGLYCGLKFVGTNNEAVNKVCELFFHSVQEDWM